MKKLLRRAGFLAGMALMTACAFPFQSKKSAEERVQTTDASSVTASDSGEKKQKKKKESVVTINVMGPSGWIRDTEKDSAETFFHQTGIKVNYVVIEDDQYERVLMDAIEKEELPDVYCAFSGPSMGSAIRAGKNALPDVEPDGYLEEAETMTSVDGINYGMAYDDMEEGYYMVYNRRVFEAAGISEFPTTFEELKSDCERLQEIQVTPIYEPAVDGWHTALLFTETSQMYEANQPGISVRLNNNTEKFADNPLMLQALGQLKELADANCFGESFISDSYADAYDRLASGEYAMCMMRPGEISRIVSSSANSDSYEEDDFGLGILPLNDNDILNVRASVPARFVNANSKKKKYAEKYLEFLASDEQVQTMIENEAELSSLPFKAGQTKDQKDLFHVFRKSFDDYSVKNVLGDRVSYLNEQMTDLSTDLASLLLGDMRPEDVLKAIDSRRTSFASRAGDPAWD
uniref:ABC transporter substrate-binding protein n=1 Tax=Eubacterium cellulosolvens TaxID=29322 RepID=UPI00068898FC|nr:ABC transporter substrate-binding protein [[Eubacterium] cellulosolvens]